MYQKDNIFDKFAKKLSLLMLLSIPLIIIAAISQKIPFLIFSLTFFFLTFGLGCLAQYFANKIQNNIDKEVYIIKIPCQITDYTKDGESDLSIKPILTPLSNQYAPFKYNRFIIMDDYPVGTMIDVYLTPELNFKDCILGTKDAFVLSTTEKGMGIVMTTIGIIVPICYILFFR